MMTSRERRKIMRAASRYDATCRELEGMRDVESQGSRDAVERQGMREFKRRYPKRQNHATPGRDTFRTRFKRKPAVSENVA